MRRLDHRLVGVVAEEDIAGIVRVEFIPAGPGVQSRYKRVRVQFGEGEVKDEVPLSTSEGGFKSLMASNSQACFL